jgi:hypothetical protein
LKAISKGIGLESALPEMIEGLKAYLKENR